MRVSSDRPSYESAPPEHAVADDASAAPSAGYTDDGFVENRTTAPIPEGVDEDAFYDPPPFTEYAVRPGDTMSDIARRFDVTLETLIAANPGVDPNLIYVGQVLLVPAVEPDPAPVEPIEHTVQAGETLSRIAFDYGTTVQALIDLNGLEDPNRIFVGQVLRVTPGQAHTLDVEFESPLPGATVTSDFGPRPNVETGTGVDNTNHYGIDLAIAGGFGPDDLALSAADGEVLFAGWDLHLGNHVIIDHGDGVRTTYAHLAEIAYGIEEGVIAQAGDTLGTPGDTGNALGVHLHFELHIDGVAVDPAQYITDW